MLCEIKIENVAVIEKATVCFQNGFNVLSGETGAGKSILIDSINAILGNRVSRELVRTGAEKAKIWATFRGIHEEKRKQIESAGYEIDDELLLYREINVDGKSACRVNGMPATASVVRAFCVGLIAIHGQHDNQSLMNPATHLSVLDAFAQNETVYQDYYTVYRKLCAVKKKIDALSMDESEKERRFELLRFQVQEIEMAQLQPGEETELLSRRDLMRHAQHITQQLQTAHLILQGDQDAESASEMLGSAAQAVENVSHLSEELVPITEKLNDLYYVSREAVQELSDLLEQMEFDPQELDELEERLDLIYKLRKKYGQTEEEILAYGAKAKKEYEQIESSEQVLEELYDEESALYETAKTLADKLTQTRQKAFEQFNKQITKALQFLNMPGIHFSLAYKKGPLASAGQDQVEFYIATNAGENPKPLARIASGGELSRIMLAVKSALADKDKIETVIYDEIDTGVSGLAAGRIGEVLRKTSRGRQVVCVTHTAQIAAQAQEHLLIQKNVRDGRTYTDIKPLDQPARVQEVARMISGDKITEIALANAKEMLELAYA